MESVHLPRSLRLGNAFLAVAVIFVSLGTSDVLRAQRPAPTNPFQRAVAFYERDLLHQAEAQFRAAIKVQPDLGQAHFGVAMCLFRTSRPAESIEHFVAAEKCPRPEAQFFANHGATLEHLSRVDDALLKFKEAAKLDPDHEPAWRGLGTIQLRRGQLKGARESLTKAAKLDPNDVEVLYRLAQLELKSKRPDEALVFARKVLARKADHYPTVRVLGQIYLRKGDRARAGRFMKQANKLREEDRRRRAKQQKIDALMGIAFRELQAGRISQAVTYLKDILNQEPKNKQARAALVNAARVYRQNQRPADAADIERFLAKLR